MAKLTEEQIDKLVERLVKRAEKANTYFLKSIGSYIKQIRSITPSQAHQLEQMLKYGGNYEKIVKQIAKYTKENVKDVDKIFETYAKQDQQFYKQFYKYRDIPFVPYAENKALQMQTKALANIARKDLYDFTRTNVLGYSITDVEGIVHFMGLRETYNQVLDKAFMSVGQGKETFDVAMKKIMQELGVTGMTTINYASGKSTRLDSAVRMHLKSRLRELHNENQRIIGEEIKADGVEVSAHPFSAPDHEDVQGRQFKIEEYDKLQAGEMAIDYDGEPVMIGHSKSGGYRPISELNCYHYEFAVVLGVNKPEYTKEELQQMKEENARGFEFEGHHYTYYEGTQFQRRLETEMRDWKNIQIAGKAADNDTLVQQAQGKISDLTQKYRNLTQSSTLPSAIQRAKVPGYARSKKKYDLPKKTDAENSILQYATKDDNIAVIIPDGAKLEGVKVIAGYQTSTPIKGAMKLYKNYPQLPQTWQKKRATTTFKGIKYEIHYLENSGKQYATKIKTVIKEKGETR